MLSNHNNSRPAPAVKVSRETPQVLIGDAEFVCRFCYAIMAQAIRSEVDKQKIELCSGVILNLSRFEGTRNSALQRDGLVTVAQMLLRWCDKECGIFNTLCSVIYVQVQSDRMREVSSLCVLLSTSHAHTFTRSCIRPDHLPVHDRCGCHLHAARNEEDGRAQGAHARQSGAERDVPGTADRTAAAAVAHAAAGLRVALERSRLRVQLFGVWLRYDSVAAGYFRVLICLFYDCVCFFFVGFNYMITILWNYGDVRLFENY